MGSKSRWSVVTGVPSSGKTTVLEHLAKAGYRIVPEASRVLIDEGIADGSIAVQSLANPS